MITSMRSHLIVYVQPFHFFSHSTIGQEVLLIFAELKGVPFDPEFKFIIVMGSRGCHDYKKNRGQDTYSGTS